MGSIEVESFNPANFNPAPLPKELPTYELPRISLAKLIEGDEKEAKAVFDICAGSNFFNLNLMDHPLGRRLWEDGCKARNIGQQTMSTISMEEKNTFPKREGVVILDRGYTGTTKDSQGLAKFVESINIPRDELFAKTTPGWQLPPWLQEHEEFFKQLHTNSHAVEQIILGVLEKQLELKSGGLTKIHELEKPSFSFLRILRYPPTEEGVGEGTLRERPRVQAHRDVVSIAMLLTWVSGLQIPVDNAEMIDPLTPTEESWRWVRPEAGQLIVNLGDSMPVLTNGVLKSGLHRVVTPHGEQSALDRISVLFTSRPNWEVPMIPLVSNKIPPQTAEQKAKPIELCKAWGDDRIKALYVDNISTGKIR